MSKRWGILPVSRITTIMKSSSDAEMLSKESSMMMTKATELFIRSFAKEGYKLSENGKKLDYKHVAEIVNSNEKYEFLRDIMPKKITVLEYKKILAKKTSMEDMNAASSSEDNSEDSDSSSSSSTSSSDSA